MKIIKTEIYEIKGIEKHIRDYGVRNLARVTGVNHTKISRAITGKLPLPEKDWKQIIDKVGGELKSRSIAQKTEGKI